jgi:hypothetical protein
MSKHTPGPWTIKVDKNQYDTFFNEEVYAIYSKPNADTNILICDAGAIEYDENKANAKLIAAAPEMFEMLEHILSDSAHVDEKDNSDGTSSPHEYVTLSRTDINEIRELVKKAKGEK